MITNVAVFFCFIVCPALASETYDYVIIGAGTAGSTLGNKLAELSPASKILFIEAGPDAKGLHDGDVNFFHRIAFNPEYACLDESLPMLATGGRKAPLATSILAGGASSHNAVEYVFGNKYDWDLYEEIGLNGWSYHSIEHIKDELDNLIQPYTIPKLGEGLGSAFEEAASELGIPVRKNYNNPEEGQLGLSQAQTNSVLGKDNILRRNCVYQLFIQKLFTNPQVKFLFKCRAHKILFNDNNEAIGVVYIDQHNVSHTVNVIKEVIVSAGALRTPQVLMLSGIGPAHHLKDFGIPVISNLPGVGMNLQDHIMCILYVLAKKPLPSSTLYQSHQLFGRHDGNYSSFAGVPDFQIIIGSRREPFFLHPDYCKGEDNDEKKCFVFLPVVLHPKSRGFLKLASADPLVNPLFNPNYLADQQDLESMKMIFKFLNSFIEGAGLKEWVHPLPQQTNEELEDFIRKHVMTVWHPCGTARAGKVTDSWAVVDENFKVRGVQKVRVADLSVLPEVTSGNTHLPALIIGTKAAESILYGGKCVDGRVHGRVQ